MLLRIMIFISLIGCLFATKKTFVRDYTYQASDYDSKITSRSNALEQVKRLLLEEISVFMQSEVDWTKTEELINEKYEVKDFYKEKITSITAGVTETKILEETWNGVVYWINAEITLDPDDIKSKIDKIVQNKEKLKELEDVKKRADNALVEIERLKKELAKAKSNADQLRLTKVYNKQSDALNAIDWFTRGYNSAVNEKYDEAVSFYLRCIELDPDFDEVYNNLGIAYGLRGNTTKAIQAYEKAIELKPYGVAAYNNLGAEYSIQGNYTKAIQAYEKAIELHPDFAGAYHNLGDIYYTQSNYTKAIQAYEKAIELYPDDIDNYNSLGLVYRDKGNYTKAIQMIEKAIELGHDDAQSYCNLGLLYSEQGKTQLFLINWKKAAVLGHQPVQDWLKENGHDW